MYVYLLALSCSDGHKRRAPRPTLHCEGGTSVGCGRVGVAVHLPDRRARLVPALLSGRGLATPVLLHRSGVQQ
eukprot:scaffold2191_cov392-Prasinococcus_capsulatus_cf.AAC.13